MKRFLIIVISLFVLNLSPAYAGDKITIASWNIQNFGKTKAINEETMALIATVLSQFDLIAVQEISNLYEKSDIGCPRNENSCPGHKNCGLLLNALKKNLAGKDNKDYGFIFSPQVNDERYLFIYDRKKIRAMDSGKLVLDEGDAPDMAVCDSRSKGAILRQPFYVTFKAGDFDFTLVTAHTSPGRNIAELQALSSFYRRIQNMDSGQNDVILLGDLNADCRYLPEKSHIDFKKPEFTWIIDNAQDTTIKTSTNCAYDRIVFTEATAEDYANSSGVFRFDEYYGLSKKTALTISDHYPVWAEFYTDKDTDH